MEDLSVESAAYVFVSGALPAGLDVYRELRTEMPPEHPLSDEEAAAVGGAVLLYSLYGRLLELQDGPEPLEAMQRAFQALESEPELDPALVAAIRERYDAMKQYKVFRSNVTVLDFIGERAWHVAYPDQEAEDPSAFQGYVQFLVEQSYGRLVTEKEKWNLV